MDFQKVNQLCDELNKIFIDLNSKYSINSGGCCYMAYIIAKNLERFNIKYKFVIFSEQTKYIGSIKKEINNRHFNSSQCKSISGNNTCEHYAIYVVNHKTINKGNFDDLYEYKLSNITADTIRWIYFTGNWCPIYNPIHNNKIARKINNLFKKYL